MTDAASPRQFPASLFTRSRQSAARRPGRSLIVGAAGLVLVATGFALPGSAAGSVNSGEARQGGVTLPVDPGKVDLAPRFGTRVLREGMTGPDVKILRSMVSSKALGNRSFGITDVFDRDTRKSVQVFQGSKGMERTGIVNGRTARELIGSMRRSGASWYGAPLYGNNTACGQKFTATIVGVAHKTLPCGTRVLIGYRGRFLLTKVIDRGPYTPGRVWDLSNAAKDALRYKGIDPVRSLVVRR